MQIDISCSRCGQNDFRLNLVTDPEALMHCHECGYLLGTLRLLEEKILKQLTSDGPTMAAAGG